MFNKKVFFINFLLVLTIFVIFETLGYLHFNHRLLYGRHANYVPYFYTMDDILKTIFNGKEYPEGYKEPNYETGSNNLAIDKYYLKKSIKPNFEELIHVTPLV